MKNKLNKQILTVLISCFLVCSLWAQQSEDYTYESLYRTFEQGQLCYILNDSTPLFTAIGETIPMANLPIGQLIKVRERTTILRREKGFNTNWYKVVLVYQGNRLTGYVWGGDIAVGHFESKNDPSITFLYGIGQINLVSRGDYEEESIKIQLNACRENKKLHGIEFEAMGTLYTKTQGNALGNKGVNTIDDVIEIAFSDGYCGGVSANATVFWDGSALHYVQLLSNGYSSQVFTNQYFIYPDDPEGKHQLILLRYEKGQFDSNRYPIYEERDEMIYIWNGANLQLEN